MRAQSAGLVAARVVFRTGAQYRPGVLGSDGAGDLDQNGARGGDLSIYRQPRAGYAGEDPTVPEPISVAAQLTSGVRTIVGNDFAFAALNENFFVFWGLCSPLKGPVWGSDPINRRRAAHRPFATCRI